jgi:ATP-dependent DNA ligase
VSLYQSAGKNGWEMGTRDHNRKKMKNCVWLRPETVAQFRFLEWTANDHLRHASFVGLREDKEPNAVFKEL